MMTAKRPTYTAECKGEAVRLVTEPGDGVGEAARHVGRKAKMLQRGQRELAAREHGVLPGNGRLSPAQEA